MGGHATGTRVIPRRPVSGFAAAVALRGAGVLSQVDVHLPRPGEALKTRILLAIVSLLASLLNGMTLMAVSPEAKYIARGTVLALAVWLDLRLGRDR
jgi:hypothetical protein